MTPQSYLNINPSTWKQRLGHPGQHVLKHLDYIHFISCKNKNSHLLCHACQLDKQVWLSFDVSQIFTMFPFQITHSDVWTTLFTK